MPELWVRFDKDNEEIMGEAYVDVIMLTSPTFDALFMAHGQKSLYDLMGSTPEEHEYLNECMPTDMCRPWQPSDSPWTPASTGLKMCRALRRAMETRPEDFNEWPGMIAHVIEVLEPFEEVLTRGEARGARFQTFGSF